MSQRLLLVIVGIMAVGLTALGVLSQARGINSLTAPVSAQVQATGQPAGITVVGEGAIGAQPDQVFVRLGVQTNKPTAKEAMDDNARKMTAVIDAIKALGIAEKDIRTGNINLYPAMGQPQPNEKRPPEVVGYNATNEVIVTADASQAGPILDAGVGAGANVAGGVQFGFKDSDTLRRQALQSAMQDARAKADVMAAGLGVKVTGVASASEGSVSIPRPLNQAYSSAAPAAAAPATPVQPGEQHITARATVTFNIQ